LAQPDTDGDSTITPRQARATAGPKRNNRLGSEPASSVFDVDTSRSYANESVVFGDTTITTPGSISTMRTSRMSHLSGVPEEGVFTGAGRVRQLRAGELPHKDVPTPSVEPEDSDDDLYVSATHKAARNRKFGDSPRNSRLARSRLQDLKMEDTDPALDEIPPTPEPSTTPGPGRPPGDGRRASRDASVETRRSAQSAHRQRDANDGGSGVDLDGDAAGEYTDEPSVKTWLTDDCATFVKGASWTYKSVLLPLTVAVVVLSILLRLAFAVGGPTSARTLKPWLPFNWGANIVILPTREADDFYDVLNRYNSEIDFLGNLKGVDGRELAQIQSWLPELVRLERNTQGEVVIPQAFWQALLGSIREEGIIMTFSKDRAGGFAVDRDEHWLAIKNRLEAEQKSGGGGGGGGGGGDASTDEIRAYIADTLPRTLEQWIRTNDKKIAAMVGSSASSASSDQHVRDVVKEAIDKGGELSNLVVSRAAFMDKLRDELASAKSQYQDEFKSMHPKLEKLVQEAVAAARSAQPPAGMTRAEATALVKSLVRSAVSAAKLEAVSSGKINADHSVQLNQRINWMNPKAGARPDADRTSPDYRAKKGLKPSDPVAAWVRQNYVAPPMEALRPWEGESDCWCGSHGTDRHGRPKGVQLSVLLGTAVMPTHLVVEHLPGSASVDPGARPKDMEVWAYIEEHEARERVLDFSAAHFPSSPASRYRDGMDDAMYDGFVKIAEFTYEDAPERNGVNVFAFDEALREAPAITDTVLLRATSNYGAPDHTCFYRVRLFGETEDEWAW
jgi:type II secretory pathway component PulM